MKSRDIARRRMYSQHLWGPRFDTLENVVRWMGALQAQEYAVAKWSVAQRALGVTDAVMDQALADGAIIRTHILRPTWHFVLPEDIRWILQVAGPRVNAMNGHYYRMLELDDRLLGKTNVLLGKALEGGRQLTRKELAAGLERKGIAATGPRLGYIMMRAELDAVICSGGLRGRQHTYASFDERVPAAKPLDRDQALAELTNRYFTARGPATLRDYSWWSSLTAADVRSGLDMVTSALQSVVVEGRTYWFAADSPAAKARRGVIDLVQGYDENIVSYSQSKDVLYGLLPSDAIPRNNVVFTHAVLLDGLLIGHWRPVAKKGSAVVETSLYPGVDRDVSRALDAAVDRYTRFMGAAI